MNINNFAGTRDEYEIWKKEVEKYLEEQKNKELKKEETNGKSTSKSNGTNISKPRGRKPKSRE